MAQVYSSRSCSDIALRENWANLTTYQGAKPKWRARGANEACFGATIFKSLISNWLLGKATLGSQRSRIAQLTAWPISL